MKRFKYLLKNILAILAVTVALFGCAMRNGSCSPNDFLGPKPGMAIVYENSLNPGVPSRVVGMDIDADGVLRIMHETTIPPGVFPHPKKNGGFLEVGYSQQFIFVKECAVVLRSWAGDTPILDLSKDKWTDTISLQIGCHGVGCQPTKEVVGRFSIISHSKRFYLGAVREIIEVSLGVQTEEYGTAGSSKFYFVSGVGMFPVELPEKIRIEYLGPEKLKELEDRAQRPGSQEKARAPY